MHLIGILLYSFKPKPTHLVMEQFKQTTHDSWLTLPSFSIPDGWQDTSWGNDEMPSIRRKTPIEHVHSHVLWLDSEDYEQRFDEYAYTLCHVDDDGQTGEFIFGSNDITTMLEFISSMESYLRGNAQ